MKNPERMDAAGISRKMSELKDCEGLNSANLLPGHEKSKSEPQLTENTARRDAKAMVFLLNRIRSGMDNFEHIYESLKRLHGKPFEEYFRDFLANKGGLHE
jgi:hypothetical protein